MNKRTLLLLLLAGVLTAAGHSSLYASAAQGRPAEEYRIKHKDELDIRVEAVCIYSTRFDVDERGVIDVPFAGEVRAAGRTAAELGSELARELGKYVKEPRVRVRVVAGRP